MEEIRRLRLGVDAAPDEHAAATEHAPAADQPALRDAAAILERAAADEVAATEARARLRRDGLSHVAPDEPIAAILGPDERVVAIRPGTVAERHLTDGSIESLSGRLYLTTERLVLLGAAVTEVVLRNVTELSLAGERLLVSVAGGGGLMLDAGSPRLLRTEIAAAIRHGRA